MTNSITILADYINYFYSIKRVAPLAKRIFSRYNSVYQTDHGLPGVTQIYYGHPALTRSLVEGLYELCIDYNYNPLNINDINKKVIVLSDNKTLKFAIKLKQKGKINKLFAGPFLLGLPSESKELMSKEIDKIIVASDWVKKLFITDTPEIKDKIIVWAAGINPNHFKPLGERQNSILLYQKHHTDEEIKPYENVIKNIFNYDVINIKYHNYNMNEYRKAMQTCKAALVLSHIETQGILFAEMWSSDLPTFTLKIKDPTKYPSQYNQYNQYNKPNSISNSYAKTMNKPMAMCPYLSNKTGISCDDVNDFSQKLSLFINGELTFSPRNWILENMTDAICAQKLLELIK